MILSVQGIHFCYNSVPVLDDISFQLDRGKILAVLGVNGAGKSTLLKCLNRILKPQLGTVLLSGADILTLQRPEIAKLVGYVPQRYDGENLTIFDAVLLGRKPHMNWGPTAHDIKIVENILKIMGLNEDVLRPVNTLSGGQAQKVIMARALSQEPDVLILDEPTSNLDIRNQFEVMGLVKKAVETGDVCAIIAIHDINLAMRFADTIMFIKNGRVHSVENKDSLTPKTIKSIYGVTAVIEQVAGHLVVVPLSCCDLHDSGEKTE
ncbi:MAG: ABC transporter ATP-binding protein [Desulfomonilaceae bacterium]